MADRRSQQLTLPRVTMAAAATAVLTDKILDRARVSKGNSPGVRPESGARPITKGNSQGASNRFYADKSPNANEMIKKKKNCRVDIRITEVSLPPHQNLLVLHLASQSLHGRDGLRKTGLEQQTFMTSCKTCKTCKTTSRWGGVGVPAGGYSQRRQLPSQSFVMLPSQNGARTG